MLLYFFPLAFPGRPAPTLHWLIDGVALRDKSRSVVTTRKDRTRDKQTGGEVIEKSAVLPQLKKMNVSHSSCFCLNWCFGCVLVSTV